MFRCCAGKGVSDKFLEETVVSILSRQVVLKSNRPAQSSDLLGPRASRPQRAEGAVVFKLLFLHSFSRFALIAGGMPAVPANLLTGFNVLQVSRKAV